MYVEMKNIYKKYGDFLASDNVSFGVEKGKLVALLGPSGSGKTTLGKIAARKLGYPYFDVDDYIWKQNTDSPYTQIVMAGSMSSFHYAFDEMFEMMVLLYVSPDIRIERVHKRAIARFGERVLEGGDMKKMVLRI